MILTESKLKRAIQSCRNKIKHHYEYTQHKKSKAIENELTKIEALKKQIPKKPTFGYDEQDYIGCPNCNYELETMDAYSDYFDHYNYCPECGQALDWR